MKKWQRSRKVVASRTKLQQTTGQLTQVFVLDLVDQEQPLEEIVGTNYVQFKVEDGQHLGLHLDDLGRLEPVVAVAGDDPVEADVGGLLVLGGNENDRHQEQVEVLEADGTEGEVLVHDVHGQEEGLLPHPEGGVGLEDPQGHF